MPRRGFPMARGGGQDLPRARTLSSAKASRHGARAKGFAPRENAPHGESLPTRRTGERICPAQKRSPRRRPPETAHERKGLPHAETLPTAKASRHGARAKRFARAGTRPSAKASRHGARAKEFAPRRNTPLGEGLPTRRTGERICPAGLAFAPRADERRAAPDRRTAGKTPLWRGRTRDGAAAAEFIHRKKIRLLHEIQLFYGESHVGSRPIFPSFPSVGRCVARERNPVPPFAPHRGRGHRSLRRTGEMHHVDGEMVRRFGECPRGGESLPRGGNAWLRGDSRHGPGLRCFGERFHLRRCANPDACRGHNDLERRGFRSSRPTFRNRRRSGEKNFRGPRCSRGQDDLGRRAFRCSRPTCRNRQRSGEKDFHARRCSRG